MKFKQFILITLSLFLILSLVGCSSENNSTDSESKEQTASESVSENGETIESSGDVIKGVMEVNGGQKVEFELYPDKAPETVANFVKLANDGFYDGLTFHRVLSGLLIQGGDPTGTGMGGSEETIVGEFKSNGFDENDLSHTRGVISMARAQDPDSATSQFFIMDQDYPGFDGDYAAFGKVVSGMDQIDKIANVETDSNDKPLETQTIEKIYITEE